MNRASWTTHVDAGARVVITIRDRAGRRFWRAEYLPDGARLVCTSGNVTPPAPVIRRAARTARTITTTTHQHQER